MAFPNRLLTLSKLISLHGIEEVIVCPGSRNAPIIVALKRNPALKLYSIIDERSAGFFAIGRALATQKPVAICCTSGSAGLNFAPALAEAFYQELPILAITADRPPEWIDQWDGQTIRQTNFLDSTVKKSYQLPHSAENDATLNWHFQGLVQEALITLNQGVKGPVHLNIPISEPFYPKQGQELVFPEHIQKIQQINVDSTELEAVLSSKIASIYQNEQRILLSIGQLEDSTELKGFIEKLNQKGIVCIGDSTANCSETIIQNHDLVLSNDKIWGNLQPNLIIHIGKSHVSKRIKQFLRASNVSNNWLVRKGESQNIIDSFQSISHIFNVETSVFLKALLQFFESNLPSTDFQQTWTHVSSEIANRQKSFFLSNNEWAEPQAVQQLFLQLEKVESKIHLGNSLSVRYSNWLPFFPSSKTSIYCNRGTSGIDGILSTYIGATCEDKKLSFLVLGDLSFFYDRNGLWNQYLTKYQRIIVLNNSGGGIFRNLEGAKDLPELEDYIATKTIHTAQKTAEDANLNYLKATNFEELGLHLETLTRESDKGILLEIFTSPEKNKTTLSAYMQLFKS